MTVRTLADAQVGTALPERVVKVTRATLIQYAGASLDRNPIHWDERFATSVGLPDVIAHGMFTMGAASSFVSDWVGDAGRVLDFGTRFTKPVVVPYEAGTEITFSGTVTGVDPDTRRATIDVVATSDGAKVLGRCLAVVLLD